MPTGEALYRTFALEPRFEGGNHSVGLPNFRQVFTYASGCNGVRVSVIFGLASTAHSFIHFWTYAIPAPAMGLAFRFLFRLAGLQAIPRSIIAAAVMDGSGRLLRVREIQFLLLSPTFFLPAIMNIIETFVGSVGLVDIVTSGGPARATDLMV